MEHIKNIEIKNFKSIRHQKIEGCKRINVFIGYPNVGKSNILEALGGMACMSKSNITNLKDLVRFKTVIELFSDGNTSSPAEVSVNDKVFLSYKFVSSTTVDILIKSLSIEKQDTVQYLRNVGDYYYQSYQDGKHVNKTQQNLLESPIYLRKYDYVPNTNYSNAYDNSLIVPFGNNLKDIIESNKVLRFEVISLFSNFNQRLLFDKADNELRIFKFLSDETVFTFPYGLVADTLKRLIFYKAAIFSNNNAVLVLEEPESHMFPPYIKKFTSDIIFDETNQFFIATHSPYIITELIEEVQHDLAIYVVDYDKGETVIKRLTDEEVSEVAQYGIDLFFNLESYLERYEQPHSA